MKRLFVALKIHPDPGFLQSYRELRSALGRDKIKWVAEHNIHITVKFLGETPETRLPEIDQTLRNLMEVTHAFSFRLSGLGVFGSSYNPRVVWTGIQPFETLATLMKQAQEEFDRIGFSADRQNLVPHLTLGRIKVSADREGFRSTLTRFRGMASGQLVADELILFESILRRDGPEYHPINHYLLKKKSLG